jgi:hypothetical protein
MSIPEASQDDGRVGVQDYPTKKTQSTSDSTQSGKRTWDGENTHGELDLQENDGRALPADSAELDALLVAVVEDFTSFKNLFLCVWKRRLGRPWY